MYQEELLFVFGIPIYVDKNNFIRELKNGRNTGRGINYLFQSQICSTIMEDLSFLCQDLRNDYSETEDAHTFFLGRLKN